MDSSFQNPRPRARRSQQRPAAVLTGARVLGVALIVALVAGGALATLRVADFLRTTANVRNPFGTARQVLEPDPGTIPWKLRHGERVNILLLGYGGVENDAPWLTDTMMVLSLDPSSRRVVEASIPRDLLVPVDAWPRHQTLAQKINVAYEIGIDDAGWPGKRPEFTAARNRGGRLSEQTVSAITGLQFDGYVAVDFKAFRDVVNALGGVDICLDTALDDRQYPDYKEGYVKGGIHFAKGCQAVNGEQALELARSRHAVQPEQASDFGRARRQQQLLNSIRKRAASGHVLTQVPGLMNALQKNFDSDLGLADLQALHEWSAKLPDSAIARVGVTSSDLVDEFYMRRGSCGDIHADVLCAQDPSFGVMKAYFANLFVDPRVLGEAAPVVVVNGSRNLEEMGDRVARSLQPLGFKLAEPVRVRPQEHSYVYDYSGGRYPLTAAWMAGYFHATVVTPTPATPVPAGTPAGEGLVVQLGRDYSVRWIGQAG